MLFNGRGSTPSYGCSSVIRHPENVDSRPCRSAPRGKGPRRARAQTSSSNVASGAATSSTSRAIRDRCESLSQLKHSMSNRRLKFEPTSAARRAFTSPSLNVTSTPACSERCRAASIALGTTSTPTTCQPRSANLTDQRPVPHPRSSADPKGSSRVSSTSASSWSNSGIIDAASDSHGVKPILYAKRYQRLTMPLRDSYLQVRREGKRAVFALRSVRPAGGAGSRMRGRGERPAFGTPTQQVRRTA